MESHSPRRGSLNGDTLGGSEFLYKSSSGTPNALEGIAKDLSRAKLVEQAHWFWAVGDFGRASLLKMHIPGPSAKGESNSGLRGIL